MGFCVTDYFVVMVYVSSLCLVLCKYKFFLLCTFYSLFNHVKEVCDRIFVEGMGKQTHRCMNGYYSAILLMLQMLKGIFKLFHGVGISDYLQIVLWVLQHR